ncbi:MAG: hypothetical protein IJR99_07880 [Kiritimatiellae bacterium]|nr:hypothetical protein [Kiritimatiellia bacterium]
MQTRVGFLSVLTVCALGSMWIGSADAAPSSRNVTAGSMVGARGASMRSGRTAGGADEAGAEGEVKVKLDPRAQKSEAPEFNANAKVKSRLVTKRREWALIECEYSTHDKWMDQLSFTYHVLSTSKDEETGKQVFNYYTTTVRYIDVPKGKHRSCVCLSPNLVDRYGEPVAMALEVTGKGSDVLATDQTAVGINLPKEWWKDDKVMSNPILKRRSGLIDRSKTPFALINPDDYEVVQ